jgi:hypothetical protein
MDFSSGVVARSESSLGERNRKKNLHRSYKTIEIYNDTSVFIIREILLSLLHTFDILNNKYQII